MTQYGLLAATGSKADTAVPETEAPHRRYLREAMWGRAVCQPR